MPAGPETPRRGLTTLYHTTELDRIAYIAVAKLSAASDSLASEYENNNFPSIRSHHRAARDKTANQPVPASVRTISLNRSHSVAVQISV